MLREDPAMEQREMIGGGGGVGGGSSSSGGVGGGGGKSMFLTSKNALDLQRSCSAGGGAGRLSLEGSNLRNLDELVGEDEVRLSFRAQVSRSIIFSRVHATLYLTLSAGWSVCWSVASRFG